MERYQKGKIYTLRSDHTDRFYIGSTCLTLPKRMYKHRDHFKAYNNGKGNYISAYELLEFDDCYIELFETTLAIQRQNF